MSNVSIVVSTYTIDRFAYVLDCVESLKKQTLSPREIILILDADEKMLEFYKSNIPTCVRIFNCKGSGLSNARNEGVRNAEGEIICFIDDDAIADKDWLKNLVKNYDNPRVVGVGGLVKPVWENGRPLWFPKELDWIVGCSYDGGIDRKTCVRNPIGCNMSFKKEVFEKVGYFKPTMGRSGRKLFGGEETEFSLRISEKAPWAIIIHDPSAVVFHKILKNRARVKYMIKRSFYGGLSAALVRNSIRSNSVDVLSVEKPYLKYLLKVSIPSRLKRIYMLENASQSLALLMSMFVVLVGYFIGRLLK